MRAKAEYRDLVKEEVMVWCHNHEHDFPWPGAAVQLFYWFSRDGKRDPDNLLAWAKSAIDGVRMAGLFQDDDQIIYLPVKYKKDKDNPRLEVRISRPDPYF